MTGPPNPEDLWVLLVTKGLDIGGIERIVVDLALGLDAVGAQVEVAVINEHRDGLMAPLRNAGIVVHGLGGSDRIGWPAARRLADLVADDRFDVIHLHGPLPSLVARLVPGRRPLVTTSHTPWRTLHRLVRLAWWATAHRDAARVAVSAAVAESLPRSAASTSQVIPHGCDPARIAEARGTVPGRHPEGGGVITAVAMASHRDVKNYPNLLQAVAEARRLGAPVRLVAVGEGPDLERHRTLAADLGLAEHVVFEAPAADGLSRIASADLLVVASDFEGAPLVVLEALALGRPVVATAVGRVPELVSPDVGRVVPPGNPGALGAALSEVALDTDLRAAMGAAATARPLTWTLDDVISAHLALYSEVAGHDARPRRAVG